MTARRAPKGIARAFALLAVGAIIAACGSNASGSGGGGGSSSGTVVVGALVSFTGSDAGYGPEVMAGCVPAADLINADGGINGKKIQCQGFNDASDPVDAVPEAHLMIARTPNLLFSIGAGSDTASAIVPIVNAAKVPIFPSSGQSVFDRNSYPYFWRMVAIDVAQGYAMAAAATSLHQYTKVAAVFANTTSAMGSEPGFVEGMKLLHEPVVDTVILPSGAPSYSSEVVSLLQKHPQLIVGELDPATAATFFTELKQVNGSMLPVLGDEPESEAPWQSAVGGAIGKSTMDKDVELVLPSSPFSSSAFKTYVNALEHSNVSDKSLYTTDVYAASYYDSTNIVALASLEAKSVKPSVVNNYILGVTNGVPGAVVVHTFAQGKSAIESGKKVRYIGASGPVYFPKYHNWEPPYNISRLNPNQSQTVVSNVSPSEVNTLLAKGNVNEQ